MKRELFGSGNPVGRLVNVSDRRFRVLGVLATEGRSIGLDVEEVVIIPVASAQNLFNTSSLFRILVEAKTRESVGQVKKQVLAAIKTRHQGEEDITVITQDAVLSTFDRILGTVTLSVAGIASVSLLVAGVIIMNIMLISVARRTEEIGLYKAIGAHTHEIEILVITESTMIAFAGAAGGLLLGRAGTWLLLKLYPALPVHIPLWSIAAAVLVAFSSGILFGIMPARRAAKMDPVMALMRR